jgi:glycosyltransferase involved in cell wall biosynthesis
MRIAIVGYPLLNRRQWRLYTKFPETDEIHLLTPKKWPTAFEADYPTSSEPVTLHRHRSVYNGEMGRYLMPGLVSTIRDLNPDIVLTHSEPWHLNTLYIEIICEVVGVPHAIFSWENLLRMPQIHFQRVLERRLLPRIDGIIAGSEAAADRIESMGYSGPLEIAPESGVNIETFTPNQTVSGLRNRFGIPQDATVVLYAGRLVKEKGIELLIDAAPDVIAENPDTHILILGEGDREVYLEDQIEASEVSDAVTLITDQQPYAEMPAIHSLASVFVYPSRTTETWAEQFGFAVAEAMSCGVPVITTECGALPHVVRDTGLVCPENNSEAIRDSLLSLLDDEKWRTELGQLARERAVTEFNFDSVAAKHRQLLDQVIQNWA